MRLLLVEDDVRIHAFLSRAVNEAGYQLDVACDGKTPLAHSAANR